MGQDERSQADDIEGAVVSALFRVFGEEVAISRRERFVLASLAAGFAGDEAVHLADRTMELFDNGGPVDAAAVREYKCCVELAGPNFRPCLIGFGEDDYPLREKLKRGLGKVVYVTVRIQDEQPEEA